MILTDDNFVSIVNAVGVGRTVYDNIKKAISLFICRKFRGDYCDSLCSIVGLAKSIYSIQLLFINLVNDSLPAIALGMEKQEPNIMKRKPRDPKEGLFAGGTLQSVLVRGTLIGIAVIISFISV